MLATDGVTVRVPFDLGASGGGVLDGGVAFWELAVTPHPSDMPSSDVRLEIAIEAVQGAAAPPAGTANPRPSPRAYTTLVLRDQQPAFLALDPSLSPAGNERPWMLLVTPYSIRSDEDLRRLFACRTARKTTAPR
jgi:hypothetical protein